MKVYIVSFVTEEKSELKAFKSKAEAQRLLGKIKRQKYETLVHDYFDIEEVEIPISAKGIIQAIELGAQRIYQ